jgi:hypothetical protein
LFVPENADYVLEFVHNSDLPVGSASKPMTLPQGQYTVTVQVVEELLKPNDTSVQTFMVDLNRHVAHATFRRSAIRHLANSRGNFENMAHWLEMFEQHDNSVKVLSNGESFSLFCLIKRIEQRRGPDKNQKEMLFHIVPRVKTKPNLSKSKIL